MITLISPAKMMRAEVPAHSFAATTPLFADEAKHIAHELKGWSASRWSHELKLSDAIADDVYSAYSHFDSATTHPAIIAYDGIVFKHIQPLDLNPDDVSPLRICSFLYGLLRPTDAIATYRLEGNIRLDYTDRKSLFTFWKPRLTEYLMSELAQDPDHTLLFLGSEEMKRLFDWSSITTTYTPLQPLFLQRIKGKLRQISVHSKMYRGAMARYALQHKWHGTPDELRTFAQNEDMEFAETDQPGIYHLIIG